VIFQCLYIETIYQIQHPFIYQLLTWYLVSTFQLVSIWERIYSVPFYVISYIKSSSLIHFAKMTIFHSYYGLIIFHCTWISPFPYSFIHWSEATFLPHVVSSVEVNMSVNIDPWHADFIFIGHLTSSKISESYSRIFFVS
jgi:hypothetical protein